MMKSSLARRYAKALCDLMPNQEAFVQQMIDVNKNLLDACDFWNNPTISPAAYEEFFIFCEKMIHPPKKWLDFTQLLINNKRMELMPQILEEYLNICGKTHKAVLLSAYPLGAQDQEKITLWLQQKLGGNVHLATEVNSSMLGGFKIQGDDFVYDATLKSSLNSLKKALE